MSYRYEVICPKCRTLLLWKESLGQMWTEEEEKQAAAIRKKDLDRTWKCRHCKTEFNPFTGKTEKKSKAS